MPFFAHSSIRVMPLVKWLDMAAGLITSSADVTA